MMRFFPLILLLLSMQAIGQDRIEKTKFDSLFYSLQTEITQTVLFDFLHTLSEFSIDTNTMCFTSLNRYNECVDGKDSISSYLNVYMDDLLGKEIEKVELKQWNKPWSDEDYYTLKYVLFYKNENPNWDVDFNFDTIIIGVDKGKVKNVIYAREWIDLDTFGK